MNPRLLLLSLLILYICPLYGQRQLAAPNIINYTNLEYKAGIQNWSTTQDENGILYFGNNEGLLTFNGKYWELFQLPNQTIIRSVKLDSQNRVFVGGQDDLGYFSPAKNGELVFTSLKHLIPEEDRNFDDIWNIVIHNDEVFFMEVTRIFHLKGNRIRIYKSETEWKYMEKAGNSIYAQEKGHGLLKFEDEVWKPAMSTPPLQMPDVNSLLQLNEDSLLISSSDRGLFLLSDQTLTRYKTDFDSLLVNQRVHCMGQINEEWIGLGTKSAGLLIINKQGELIQQYGYREGMQTNNVRSIFVDQNQGLWLGLDDGIDYIDVNGSIKQIHPDKDKRVTGYAAASHGDKLYIGTSDGLYLFDYSEKNNDLGLSKGDFAPVKSGTGQVWNLQEINGSLLMAHEDGAFFVEEDQAYQIYPAPGTWMFQPASTIAPSDKVYIGTYLGLAEIDYKEGAFQHQRHLEGFDESLRFMVVDYQQNAIWGSHPYRGIFRLELSADQSKILHSRIYQSKDGLPSDLYNYLFRIKNRLIVATEDGLYEYEAAKDRFIPSNLVKRSLAGVNIQHLKEDSEGNIWFISNKKVGVIDYSQPTQNKPFTIIHLPELSDKVVGGHESIYPLDMQNIFIGSNKGFFHINYTKYRQNITQPDILFGKVRSFGKKDSVLYGGYPLYTEQKGETKEALLPYSMNSLHFEYSSTLFGQFSNLEYSYFLEGFDREWSAWINKSEKDYTNLPAGHYIFKVKSRNNLGNESTVSTFTFEISPPWYKTIWSYLVYLFIVIGLFALIFKRQKKKHLQEQTQLKHLHQLKVDKSEKEIVKLRNEKLQADINFKNQELASTTMHLVQRGKVLTKIKEELMVLGRNHRLENESADFKRLLKLISEVERSDSDWDRFSVHFDHVHSNFLSTLKDKYPELTPNELKICAFIKMNLSSKEIAQLMSISLKAVEVGRYRLRKKLKISSEINLFDFLVQSTSSTDQ
ncbi:histidine kinase [Echinicola pacifica]|uniref:Histidine kinase n=1 Tax=Echinicola pacifica TaxID=346377 RepID=A0A918Q0M8_9BACT|nr:triple tyrosine motif-containing protein [Echinicola pacifica]GGZ29243.1 histidine kinase [Echinicola pacifica]